MFQLIITLYRQKTTTFVRFVFCRRGRKTADMTTSCPIPWDQPQTNRRAFLAVLNPRMDRKAPQQASDQWTHEDSLLITW